VGFQVSYRGTDQAYLDTLAERERERERERETERERDRERETDPHICWRGSISPTIVSYPYLTRSAFIPLPPLPSPSLPSHLSSQVSSPPLFATINKNL